MVGAMEQASLAAAKFREIEDQFDKPQPVLERLKAAYSEPHRRYHTLSHILEMLDCFSQSPDLAEDRTALSLAIWFHDVVYDPTSPPGANEAASAELLEEMAKGRAVAPAIRMILHSAHHDVSADPDTQLFCDLDLYRLGVDEEAFLQHDDDVRFEYRHVSDADWRVGRAAFLDNMLARPTIYQTRHWRDRCEKQARRNLAAACARLMA